MISNLLMAAGKQAPVSTVDIVDPFGDNSGVALYKFDGDATGYGAQQNFFNSAPWQLQWDFNDTQSGNISGWVIDGSVPSLDTEGKTCTFIAKSKAYIINSKEKSVFVADINTQGNIGSFSLHSTLPTAMGGSVFFTTPTRVYLYNSWQDNISASYYATIGSDGTLSSWNTGTAFPLPLRSAMTFSYGGYVYVCGGHHSTTFSTACYYAPINPDGTIGTWSTTSALPNYKGDGCVLVTKRRVYLIGGYDASNNSGITNTTTFNTDGTLASWGTVTSAPAGLSCATIIATSTSAYYFGGLTTGNMPHASCYIAPIDADGILGSWTLMGTFPKTIAYYGMFATSSKLYLVGGKQDGVYSQTIYSAPFSGGMNDYSNELVKQKYIDVSGTASNVTYGTGKFGQSAVFDNISVNNKISLSQKVIDKTDTYSISCWLKITTAGLGGIYCSNTLGWNQYGIEFMLGPSAVEFSHVRSDAVSGNGMVSTSQKADGVWRHYVVTRDGTSIKLYENTTLVSSGTLIHNTTANYANPYIGQYINGNTNTPQGIKQLDQLRLFNRALTQQEVISLFEEAVDTYVPYVPPQGFFNDGTEVAHYAFDGDATDESGTYNGTPTNVTYGTGKIGQCAVFNGSSSYVSTSYSSTSVLQTISVWVKMNSISSSAMIIDSGWYSEVGSIFMWHYNSKLYYGIRNGGTYTERNLTCLSVGVWEHLCLIVSSNSISLYNDGVLVDTAGHSVSSLSGINMVIGKQQNGSYAYLNGSIDQVRIFNRALTATEVTALYNEGQ